MRWRKRLGYLKSTWVLRLLLSIGFLFILFVGRGILYLHSQADLQLHGETVVARLRANVAQMSVIEYHWRLNGGIHPGLETRAGEGSAEDRLNELVASIKQDAEEVQNLSDFAGRRASLLTCANRYIHSIQRLRQLYRAGNQVQAYAYDDHNVDNAYDDFEEALNLARQQLEASSVAARSLASTGTLVALIVQFCILAAATIGLSAAREKGVAMTAQQEVLTLSERRLGVLLGNVNAAVLVISRSGDCTYASPRTASLFGFKPKRLSDLLDKVYENLDGARELLQKTEGEVELTLALADGRRDFLLQARSLFDDPAVQGQVLVWHDVTLDKRAHRAIEEARDSAVNLSKLKSEFLANMSHEIRTPMNGVLGMVDLLLDTELTTVQADYTETIRSCGNALLALLNDILDFSKLESGRLLLEQIAFDPAAIVEECADIVRVSASKKGLELILALDEVDWVQGDPTRLRQVILNLLSNAVKFTSEGEVVVTLESLESRGNRRKLRIAVKDSGIGIPADKIDHIFGAFHQVDGSTTRVFGGTGLGLSISQQLVGLMGGELTATSSPGKGSEFSFVIETDLAEQNRSLDEGSLRGKKILTVVNHPTNRASLAATLTRWGCEAVATGSAVDALHLAKHERFDATILDDSLPEGGADLARALNEEGHPSPIILLTQVSEPTDLAGLHAFGVRQILSKPARRSDLRNALRLCLGLSVEASPESTPEDAKRGMRVLVVEDNPVNQTVARKLLSTLGCEVRVASGGLEALDLLANESYDLVFMDCLMPDMDGYETTRRLRASSQSRNRGVPIVALTASALEGDRLRCFEAGMDDFVPKPVNRAALQGVLDRWREQMAA